MQIIRKEDKEVSWILKKNNEQQLAKKPRKASGHYTSSALVSPHCACYEIEAITELALTSSFKSPPQQTIK